MSHTDAPAIGTTHSQTLARSVEELTPAWFTDALGKARPGIVVTHAHVNHIIWGSATKVFVDLTYDGDAQGLPEKLCVKGGFDERSRAFGLGAAYELEGYFYRDLAPTFSVETPDCYYAEAEAEQGISILEDLRVRGAEFGDAENLWAVDSVADALEVQARWHGELWGTKGKFDWLPVGATAAREAFKVMLSPEQFYPLIARDEVPELTGKMSDDKLVRSAFRTLWEHDDSAPHTINHGDAHVAQLYRIPGEKPAFLDWQTACLAPWSHDVAYFLGSALSIEDRRSNERALLNHYREALHTAGGPDLTENETWLDYRRHSLHGFAWMCVPTVMQPSGVIAAMTSRYATAIDDLDPFTLLGH
ncbi:phosphotransferase [Rhodococcus erythropolis]|uniref:phosphotransferase n=1 Tax=Rhodococcus erythropolis TaxID=1833 RepID=UPI00294A7802|nr:phosphotransferase [Rhodococcus erythropolis]MDV6211965.1 phosphotransferase [Rhodococcus erythropolis]